jgi:hypothetical protein
MIKLLSTMTCITLGLASASMAQDVVITQNDSCDTDSLGAVACGDGTTTAENWYARNILVDQTVSVNSISWGAANATTVTANIFFSISSGAGNPDANTLTPVGTATQLMDVGGLYTTAVDVPFTVPAGSYLVVEMQFPDTGTDPGVFVSTSASPGSTTYLKADDCGITAYSTVDDIGFPDSQITMCLNASPGEFDPCNAPLPAVCAADVDMDGSVAVSDVLAIIGAWGSCGDGTFRPTGDIAPMPNGDCCVTVADVLAVVGSWGADCNVYGGCCLGDGTCTEATSMDCAADGGTYFGDNSTCADGDCTAAACCIGDTCSDLTADACADLGGVTRPADACSTIDCSIAIPGDECADALVAIEGANPFDTTGMTAGADLPTCTADEAAFGWEEPTNDVWFAFTAGNTVDYNIDTCDAASFDTSVVVYDACSGNAVACNGDGTALTGCQQFYSDLVLSADAGSTYYIRIGGWNAAELGAGTLNIGEVPPPMPGACCLQDSNCLDNLDDVSCAAFGGVFAGDSTLCADEPCAATGGGDECADAYEAFDGANAFDTTLATPSSEVVDDTQCSGTFLNWADSKDIWMFYVATGNGTCTFSACDAASYDTSMVLYEGTCDNQVACNGDASGEAGCQSFYSAISDFPVTAGTTYLIRMGAYNGGASAGPGTVTITLTEAGATAACCAQGSCVENTIDECNALGGSWVNGATCADVACYSGCPAGADVDCDDCALDGDDSALDCNAGLNGATGTEFQDIALGTPVCGTGSVFVDGPTGETYRDLDWYTNATLNAGGDFTISVGTSGEDLLFGLVDNAAGAFIEAFTATGGLEATVTFATVPAGDYSILVGPADWNTDWTCDSGLVDYWVQLD